MALRLDRNATYHVERYEVRAQNANATPSVALPHGEYDGKVEGRGQDENYEKEEEKDDDEGKKEEQKKTAMNSKPSQTASNFPDG